MARIYVPIPAHCSHLSSAAVSSACSSIMTSSLVAWAWETSRRGTSMATLLSTWDRGRFQGVNEGEGDG